VAERRFRWQRDDFGGRYAFGGGKTLSVAERRFRWQIDAFGGDAFGGDAFGGDAFGDDAFEGDAFGCGETLSGRRLWETRGGGVTGG
jgi:hypothetical protein